jgi:branched-chain amino acid transport system ATP-binding protein
MSMLEASKLKVSYGGINAVKGIDLYVDAGEMVALIGANGAGKTTTLKAVCGLLHHGGHVRYNGEDVSNRPAYQLVELGIALVPEGRGVFGRLSVEENLQMGAYVCNDKALVRDEIERMFHLFPRLKERRGQAAGTLSGGEQQMLAIGRALMSQPRLLLLDEPSMGLAPLMVEKIFEVVRQVSSDGVTILLVEQNARLALDVSNRGYVMESGLVTLSGDSASLLDNPQVRQAYLGE